MELNPWNLSFKGNQKMHEIKYFIYYYVSTLKYIRSAIFLGLILFNLLGILDIILVPEFKKQFLFIRFTVVTPIAIIAILLSYRKNILPYYQSILSILLLVPGIATIYMATKVSFPEVYYYYTGLILILVFGYTILRIRFIWATTVSVLLILFYEITTIFFSEIPRDVFIANNFYFISANILGMIASYSIEYFSRKNYYQSILLRNEQIKAEKLNKDLESKIKSRTSELLEKNDDLLKEIETRKKTEKDLIISRQKAIESEKLKTAFLSNMSHEIRTPMNAILGFSDLLAEPEISDEVKKEYTHIINSNGETLMKLIEDIITISKIEAGQVEIKKQDFNVTDLLKEVISTLSNSSYQKKGVELRLNSKGQEEGLIVNTDLLRIKQTLFNLVTNAIKFTEEGYVELGYSLNDYNDIEFYVKDTGIGMPKNKQKVIFEHFMKLDDSKTKLYRGTGLGLSIAMNYIKLLDGKIWVDSEPGKGSTFYFTIPYVPAQKTDKNVKVVTSKPVKYYWPGKKILIVEDVESNYLYLKEILKKTATELMWAKDGLEAVSISLENNSIDLILMDVQLPNLNGYEATAQIKSKIPNIIVIAQTAYALTGEKEKSEEAGCDGYISKPIKPKELLEMLNHYL